MGMEK